MAEQCVVRFSEDMLSKRFEEFLSRLQDRGCPPTLLDMFMFQRMMIMNKVVGMEFLGEESPFIPVIPLMFQKIPSLMGMVDIGGKRGVVRDYDPIYTDEVSSTKFPYFMLGVEPGRTTEGIPADSAREGFRQARRTPLSVAEAISLAICTEVLGVFSVGALGSRNACSKTPCISVDSSTKVPELLSCHLSSVVRPGLAFPSCAERVCYL